MAWGNMEHPLLPVLTHQPSGPYVGEILRNTKRRTLALGLTGALAVSGLTTCSALTQPDGSGVTGTSTVSETSSMAGSPFLWADGSAISVTPHKLDLAQTATASTDYAEHFSTRD